MGQKTKNKRGGELSNYTRARVRPQPVVYFIAGAICCRLEYYYKARLVGYLEHERRRGIV